jgi:predicted MFS family arabinose efflux permease
VLIATALGSLIFALIEGERAGYRSPWIALLFVASATAAILFVFVERRSRAPTFDVRYLRVPAFSGALVVAFAVYFAIFSIFFFVALYLVEVVGYGGFRIAAQFAPMTVTMVLASLFAGRWVARTGPRAPMTIGCLAAGVGVLLTEVALRGNVSTVGLASSLALAGFGFGVTVVPVTSVPLAVVPAERSGMAASATNTSRELGSVVGVAVLGSMVNGFLTHGLSARLAHLGVPPAFRQLVIDAIERGEVPNQAGLAAYQASYGPVVTKVVQAAYGAFHAGLNVALIVSGVAIIASGVASWTTLTPTDASLARSVPGGLRA